MASQSPPASETSEPRTERSCATCRRRKVRCDKHMPCGPCSRGGHACSYPPKEPRRPRVGKTTMCEVANRIQKLEKTLSTIPPDRTFKEPFRPASVSASSAPAAAPASTFSPTSAPRRATSNHQSPGQKKLSESSPRGEILLEKGSSSQYFNEVLVSRVIGQESDVRTALATPSHDASAPYTASPFNPMGILSVPSPSRTVSSLLPHKGTAVRLWSIFVDNVDCMFKMVHVPSTELVLYTVLDNPEVAPFEHLALCFAIYYSAAVALDDADDSLSILGESWNDALQRYKTGLEQAFASVDLLENPTVMLVQAMGIYASSLRVHNTGRAVWTLNGLAIRIAQSIGLHRDGNRLGLSPFESEIRRRLWWYLVGKDGRAAEDYGLHDNPTLSLMHGSELPRNLDDGDLHPDMVELPPSRKGWTRMTMVLCNIHLSRAWAELLDLSWSGSDKDPPSTEARNDIVHNLKVKIEALLEGSNPVIPIHRMTILLARFLLRKLDFVTMQQWEALAHPNKQEMLATEENLQEALGLLEEGDRLRDHNELLRPYMWSLRSYPQYHLLLFVLWHICVRPGYPSTQRAFDAVDRYVKEMEAARADLLRGPKWTILKALMTKAATLVPPPAQDLNTYSASVPLTVNHANNNMEPGFMTTQKFVEMSDAGLLDSLQTIPDWSTLLQDFLQEENNFNVLT